MRIKNVIFDLDGTLLDTTEGVLESVKYTAEKLAYPVLPPKELLRFIGPPIQQSFMTYYGASQETAQKAADIFTKACPNADVNLLQGGQPVYYFLISAE